MQLKSLISKNNISNLVHIAIYIVNIIFIIVLFIFFNNNVYKSITTESGELKNATSEAPKDINIKKFNEIIQIINSKKENKQLNIRNIF